MNSYKVFIKRGNEWFQQSFFGQKCAAVREANEMRKLGYESKIMRKGVEVN